MITAEERDALDSLRTHRGWAVYARLVKEAQAKEHKALLECPRDAIGAHRGAYKAYRKALSVIENEVMDFDGTGK